LDTSLAGENFLTSSRARPTGAPARTA